jgi:hypothetical protein
MQVQVQGRSLVKAGPSTPWPWTPLSDSEIIRNYKDFLLDLMRSRDLSQLNTISYDPFSVGHALAVLNEKVVLNVTTDGLASILKTPAHKMAKSYQKLLGILTAVSHINICRFFADLQNSFRCWLVNKLIYYVEG